MSSRPTLKLTRLTADQPLHSTTNKSYNYDSLQGSDTSGSSSYNSYSSSRNSYNSSSSTTYSNYTTNTQSNSYKK